MTPELIESLLFRLRPQLHRIASRFTSPEVRNDIDDYISELYYRLAKKSVPTGTSIEPYTIIIFKSLIKDQQRTCNRRRARDVKYMQGHKEVSGDQSSARVERRELRWHIKRAVRRANLRRDYRCALWAWVRDALPEFADRRGISSSTARVWASRARTAIRPYLEHLRPEGV